MNKVVIHRAGGHDRLTLEQHPSPTPAPQEVLIAVEAAGVNYADVIVRRGLYATAKKYVGWPITPGFEVAGTVAALGAGVAGLAVGDPVLAVTLFNGYSTEVAVPRHQVFPIPAGFTVPEAAAFPAVFITAWYGLTDLAHPRPGETILVHSAAGGVGSSLVQLGKIAGCTVVGVVGSSHKVDFVRDLGADHVIDKSTQDLWAEAERIAPDGYHVVLDANGVATLKQSYGHLAKGGKLVVYGFHTMMPKGGGTNWLKLALGWLRTPRFNPLHMTTANRSVLSFNLSDLFARTDILGDAMGQLVAWADAGQLRPPKVTPFPLERVAEAHAALESGRTTGKLVLLT